MTSIVEQLFFTTNLLVMYLNDAVASLSDYESVGLSSILDEGSQRTAHPAVHSPKMG